jgi:HD superfamily phosphodiesterase
MSELASITDPELWLEDSAELAKKYAYAPPVSTGSNATHLTREHETNACIIAARQPWPRPGSRTSSMTR